MYSHLLRTIKLKLKTDKLFVKDNIGKSILRIGLHSLGSPMWFSNGERSSVDNCEELTIFLYCLKALVRSAFTVALVTIPSHLFKEVSDNFQLQFV